MDKQDNKSERSFGDYIRSVREAKELMIKDIAQKSNLSIPYISRLENNIRKKPSFQVLKRLANALEVSVFHLIQISIEGNELIHKDLMDILLDSNYTVKGKEVSHEVRILINEIMYYIINDRWKSEGISDILMENLINKIKLINNLL